MVLHQNPILTIAAPMLAFLSQSQSIVAPGYHKGGEEEEARWGHQECQVLRALISQASVQEQTLSDRHPSLSPLP